MLIYSLDVGITKVAVANHSSFTNGGASGSSRTEASISSSVKASTRAQSVRGRSTDLCDFCFEEVLLTDIRSSGRDNPTHLISPRKNYSKDTILGYPESLVPRFSVFPASVHSFEYSTTPNR
jgi:hypothetical protein